MHDLKDLYFSYTIHARRKKSTDRACEAENRPEFADRFLEVN